MKRAAVLVVALVVGSAGAHAAPVRAPAGSILLLSGRDGGTSLYVVNADGTGLKRIVANVDDARWSPDGSRIVFRRGLHLSVVGTNGRGPRRVGEGWDPTWAPDNRRLAFSTSTGISVVDVSTGRQTVLTRPAEVQDRSPQWSPNGRRIAFLRTSSGYPDLYVIDRNGAHLRRLAGNGLTIGSGAWSPDGVQLAYQGSDGVYVINVANGHMRLLTGKVSTSVPPSWSPRGDAIALSGYLGSETGVWIMRPSGGTLKRVFGDRDNLGPEGMAWSPDGKRLAVTTGHTNDVSVVNAANRARVRVTHGWQYGYPSSGVQWQPRGRTTATVRGKVLSPAVPTDSVAAGNVLRTRSPVARLAADGSTVAIVYGTSELYVPQGVTNDCIEAWNPAARRLVRFHHQCLKVLDVGIAKSRVAWVDFTHGAGTDAFGVSTATLNRPASSLTDVCVADAHPQPCFGPALDIQADGSLLVFGTFGQTSQCFFYPFEGCPLPRLNGKLWRLEGTHAVQIGSSAGALTPLSADGGRILADHEDGTLEVVRANGTSIKTLHVDHAGMLGARLQGRDLVVQMGDAILDYDGETGALLHEWSSPGGDARLDSVRNGVAVFVSGADIDLLRLADNRSAVIRVPGEGPVNARFASAGLFYSYTARDTRSRGRVVFVPFKKLPLG